MNGQDPEVEPPRWSECGYGLYQWSIFGVIVSVGTLLFLLSIVASLKLHQIIFNYTLQ